MSYWRAGEPALWMSAGSQNNPTTSTILADTGPIAQVGDYMAQVIICCDAISTVNIQWRTADNSANVALTINGVTNVQEQRVFFNVAGGGIAEFVIPMRINNANERLRVVPNATVTGNVSASIYWQRMT